MASKATDESLANASQVGWVGQHALLLGLVFVLLAAAVARFYRLGGPDAPPEGMLHTLPPGLNPDEAVSDLGGLAILTQRRLFPFIKIETGVGAAHSTLTALVFLPAKPFAVGSRYASAIASLISVLAAAELARAMFVKQVDRRSRQVLALAAAIVVGFSYWFINFGRLGMEQILAPALGLAAAAIGWRAIHGSWGMAALAGFLLGLAPYAYPAAYFIPPAIGLFLVIAWVIYRPPREVWLTRVAVYAGAAFAAALPLLLFAAREPEWILMRSSQVSGALTLEGVGRNLLLALQGMFIDGDYNPRSNLPGRPLLDPIQIVLFVVGLVSMWRKPTRPQASFVSIWIAVALLPEILTNENLPHFGRLAAVVAPLFVVVAYGVFQVWRYARRHWGRTIAVLAFALCTAAPALSALYGYFVLWPRTPGYLFTFSTAARLQARLTAELPPESIKYLTPIDRDHFTIAFIARARQVEQFTSFNGRECVLLPPPDADAYYLIAALQDTNSRPRLEQLLPGIVEAQAFHTNGSPFVQVMHAPAGTEHALPRPLAAPPTIDGLARLLAWEVSPGPYRPGSEIAITLFWESLVGNPAQFTRFLHLLDDPAASGGLALRSGADARPCLNAHPTVRWRSGEILAEDVRLQIPDDTPAGIYHLQTGFYDAATGVRVSVNPGGQPANLDPPNPAIYLQSIQVESR